MLPMLSTLLMHFLMMIRLIRVGDKESVHPVEGGMEIWSPAHTLSVNHGVECTYDLSRGETPMITLRPIATKTSCAEILWIYQQQSNDLVTFDELIGMKTWDDAKPLNENEMLLYSTLSTSIIIIENKVYDDILQIMSEIIP